MAKNEIVWGIDVGNTSLKALRCRRGSEPGTLEVLGFDFIQHSKVMTQPGADPAEIMAESLAQFLSRNDIRGEKIAISVAGQSALWRFQPLPPVDPKKVKELVKYEVRQWLPFNLDDVIWTYRQVGGMQEGNILLDANIFMYAMKKELPHRIVKNYADNKIDVDAIQGAPVALYNAYIHNFYTPEELAERDPVGSNDFDIILNVGTDTTDIVITNGVTIWLRNIPVGGNSFTKSLTKSLKLTFSNAEHIKRNAAASQDPKAVILAMKPVFSEMQSEIDRSIKYYCSLNKNAKIRRIYALGNAMKLPGLRQFLAKSHGLEVIIPDSFPKLQGQEVLNNPQFKENLSSFAVSYGLALQLLHQSTLDINLIPPEIVRDRLINSKKPWALAAAAFLLLAFAIQYVGATAALGTVQNDGIKSAMNAAKSVHSESDNLLANVQTEVENFKKMDVIGKTLTSNVEGRQTWVELIRVINSFIPAQELPAEVFSKSIKEKEAAILEQDRVYIKNIEVIDVPDLSVWFNQMRQWYTIDDIESEWFTAAENGDSSYLDSEYYFPPAVEFGISALGAAAGGVGGAGAPSGGGASGGGMPMPSGGGGMPMPGGMGGGAMAGGPNGAETSEGFTENKDARLEQIPGPSGPGRVVQLVACHYHNPNKQEDPNRGPEYVRRGILKAIKHGTIDLPVSLETQRQNPDGQKTDTYTYKEFGIFYPVMVNPGPIIDNVSISDPEAENNESSQKRANAFYGSRGNSTAGGSRPNAGRSSEAASAGRKDIDPMRPNGKNENDLTLRRFDFVIQFVWQETPPTVREQRKTEYDAVLKAREEIAKAQEGQENGDADNPNSNGSSNETANGQEGGAE